MAIVNLNTIKNWFRTGLKPTETQFWDTWDSFRHKSEKVPAGDIEGIDGLLLSKADKVVLDDHLTNSNAHATLFDIKEDKAQKGAPSGYAPLNEFLKLSSQYLSIVDDLVTGGSTALLSAEQGKVLQIQITAINTLLTSDNVNLDTVQELVDAIETVQTSLSTILVNDLTTGGITKALTAEMGKLLQANKVDKVAGERLINVAEITKLAGLGNVVTTVKTILSTALVTQNIAGFVTYINTLVAPLMVGANEIVEYKTSDTGRVFKLLLRGRSFGVGQPAIVTTDVIEITEFLNKDIRLSNYPSTRNDGQLPTNKVLAPDVNGNLKLYTIATAPAPYLDELIPDSYLPNNTGNFILKGAFFTPTMTISIVGQTVNYITFINDNEVRANVTTGSAEGSFDVILNNGLSATFSSRFLVVLGTVYSPKSSDWTNPLNNPDLSEEAIIKPSASNQLQRADWRTIPANQNFRLLAYATNTPMFTGGWDSIYISEGGGNIQLFDASNPAILVWQMHFRKYSETNGSMSVRHVSSNTTSSGGAGNPVGKILTLERINGVYKVYINDAFTYTFSQTTDMNLLIRCRVYNNELRGIKFIQIA